MSGRWVQVAPLSQTGHWSATLGTYGQVREIVRVDSCGDITIAEDATDEELRTIILQMAEVLTRDWVESLRK